MLFPGVQRHLPKSPLRKRDSAVRAELTHLSTRLLKLEREQEIQLKRIARAPLFAESRQRGIGTKPTKGLVASFRPRQVS